jgi:N-acetylgalactosamine kinase
VEIVSLILAGGRGSRMRCEDKNKVCFEVDGVPAILRALQTYEECGIGYHVVVVGALGEQVLQTVGPKHPNASFVFQPEPRGTGDAARCGARLLQAMGYEGLVLLAMGDRLIAPHIVHRMVSTLRDTRSDIVFLVGSKAHNPSSGTVLLDDHKNVAAIVESSEIALSKVVGTLDDLCLSHPEGVAAQAVEDVVRGHFPTPAKAEKACRELLKRVGQGTPLPVLELKGLLAPLREQTTIELWREGQLTALPARQVEDLTTDANLGMYLFQAPILFEALSTLEPNNAQGEYFLTDCAKTLSQARFRNGSPRYRLRTVRVDHPDDSVSFNSPEELAEIERRLQEDRLHESELASGATLPASKLMPVGTWRRLFAENDPLVQEFLTATYGPVPELHDEKRQAFGQALDRFIELYGAEREVLVIRSPGRVNLMGSHVDHRGGNTNVIAINDEVIMVAAARTDGRISLRNTDEAVFPPDEFSLARDIADLDWSDWLTCVNSPKTLAVGGNGGWSNYVRAAALRLQQRFRRHPLRGADVVIHGSIPVGSGLSSSSAVVVSAAEMLVAFNHLPVRPAMLIDLCGEGEWFVGTRGGASDHAAIKCGRRGLIAHIGFFPFEIKEFVPFPEGYCVVVCNSGVTAHKSGNARVTFNTKILGYLAGELMLKRQWPQVADRVDHLRDLTCENLEIDLAELYEGLLSLPLQVTARQLQAQWGPFDEQERSKLNSLLSALPNELQEFDVRSVTLYGLAEIERAQRCLGFLQQGEAEAFGALWYLSHDGDRVVSHDENLQPQPYEPLVSDEYLTGLIADVRSGDPERVERAQLYRQPGSYRCSTPELDLIVDLAQRQPGVVGAQLAGAGLGGCALILVREDCGDNLIAQLAARSFTAQRYYPVEGAGLVNLGPEES